MSLRDLCLENDKFYHFFDPISLDIMNDPVITADGLTYDRKSIETWFSICKRDRRTPLTSPLTNLVLENQILTPNVALKQEIMNFFAENNSIKFQDIKFSLSSELYTYLDNITDCDLFKELNLRPPQIIVLGNESHGKSSLLEKIVGLPLFPRDKNICTRCVIRVQLRRSKVANPLAEINIINSLYNQVVDTKHVPIDLIRSTTKEITDGLLQEQPNKQLIDNREIVIKIKLPFVLNLDLVDLPGLMTTIPVGCRQDLPKVSRDIAIRIIEQEKMYSFFLLVNDLKVPPNQSRGCEIIQKAKVQDKTLGIFTKIDTFSSEDSNDSEELKAFLQANLPFSFPVTYGWMGTSSKLASSTPSDASNLELHKLYKTDEEEKKMIEVKFQSLQASNKLGIRNIRQKIQSLYDKFVFEKWIPGIISFLKTAVNYSISSIETNGFLPFGEIEEYQPLFKRIQDYFQSHSGSSHPYFSSINSNHFLNILNSRLGNITSNRSTFLVNNNNIRIFFKLRNKILNNFLNDGQTYKTSNLLSYFDTDAFIKQEVENLSNDFKELSLHLCNSIENILELMKAESFDEQTSDDNILTKFPIAHNSIKRHFEDIAIDCKDQFNKWFETALKQLFAADEINLFKVIKFRFAPQLISLDLNNVDIRNPNITIGDLSWTWANPSIYPEFIEMMLCQYLKITRHALSNVFSNVKIPENAFKVDSDIPDRLRLLTNIITYIDAKSEIERLQANQSSR